MEITYNRLEKAKTDLAVDISQWILPNDPTIIGNYYEKIDAIVSEYKKVILNILPEDKMTVDINWLRNKITAL